jgi:hypothetical protein
MFFYLDSSSTAPLRLGDAIVPRISYIYEEEGQGHVCIQSFRIKKEKGEVGVQRQRPSTE